MSSGAEKTYLSGHQAHDYSALMARWQAVVDTADLRAVTLAEHGGYPVMGYRRGSDGDFDEKRGLYLCAGVHGDEPAGTWGLLEWAEDNVDVLRATPVLILPCFNPWGLVENRRSDHRGRDLNRLFDDRRLPLFKAWRRFVGERRFRLALHLHEDYDARGIYIYELGRRGHDLGHPILEKCRDIIPIETRREVDGNAFDGGVLARKQSIARVIEEHLDGGWPEAIYVHQHHARFALTFETPSEFSLWDRVRAHRRFLSAAIEASGLAV